jgi:hypothetical protein
MSKSYDRTLPVKVADIQLDFQNKKLIEMLTNRGKLLANSDYERVPEVNKKISNYISSPKGYKELKTVTSAFIIFENENGYKEAIDYMKDKMRIFDRLNLKSLDGYVYGLKFAKT